MFLDEIFVLAAFGRLARKNPCGIFPIFLRIFPDDPAQIRLAKNSPKKHQLPR
ncbi:MAG: hypothetical protein HUU55_22260 [Myxococcales bacterium]|nr:hypothetical protein [Myxococcales bacterium]